MIEELEEEITETRFIAQKSGAGELKKLENEKNKLQTELISLKNSYEEQIKEISKKILSHLSFI